METGILILGKGDDIITMILDNLHSNGICGLITIFNNLKLPPKKPMEHDGFKIDILEDIDLSKYQKYCLGVYKPAFKKKIIELLKPDLNKFINIIHNNIELSTTSTIGTGCLINSRVSVAAHTRIQNFVSINRHVSIGHHSRIGEYASINPGCNLAGGASIGDLTTIGMGTNILNDIIIGRNSIIGAGSLVTKNIPDNVIAYGSPCRIVREND